MDSLDLEVQFLPGVGPKRAELLSQLGIATARDLLGHFPRRYEDRRQLRRIRDAVVGETQVLYGELLSIRERRLRGRRTLLEARLADVSDEPGPEPVPEPEILPSVGRRSSASATIELCWFNQSHLLGWLRPGVRLYVYGTVKLRRERPQMASPEFELDTERDEASDEASPHVKRIVPVYPLTRGVHQRFLRGLVHALVSRDLDLPAGPHDVLLPEGLSAAEAFRELHFPSSWRGLERARRRFIFEEYFHFATHLYFRRRRFRAAAGKSFVVTSELDRKIRSIFPFEFTSEQNRVVGEIVRDLQGPSAAYRLLQGDVGTGKTAVALYGMLVAVRNGCQAAMMAPTEILAEQHHRTVSHFLRKHPVRVELLTGSQSPASKREVREGLETGAVHIVVGTHALIQDDVRFRRLGLVVIDEQHRFGVRDRMRLRLKGDHPHLLVMTATPIPRSLCLTSYGDLDLSVLKDRPRGRQPVKTFVVERSRRGQAMSLIRRELVAGRQAYFIYPLIEESETLALPAAEKAYQHLSTRVFPEFRVGLVHGRLSASEKESVLARFRAGEIHILVATVVVEVGIDVPNATVLFLEDASRFGLAQLHQLRGRVGRGAHPGCCLVGVESTSADVRKRLKAFASTEDGFQIAEEDLRLRGPGDYLGVRQSGRPRFVLGNPLENLAEFLDVRAQTEAFWAQEANVRAYARWVPPEAEDGLEGEAEGGFLGLD